MIQRLAEAVPVGCSWCDSKVTRGILEEHRRLCSARPLDAKGDLCPVHDELLNLDCPFDGSRVCHLCAAVGSHRHHFQQPAKESGKEEIPEPSTSTPTSPAAVASLTLSGADQATAISYACLLCLDAGIPLTVGALQAILSAANCSVDPELLTHFAKANFDLAFLSQVEFNLDGSHKVGSVDAIYDANEEYKASEEFEKLRKNYHDNLFNFQGIQMRSVPLGTNLVRKFKNQIYFLWELKMGTRLTSGIEDKTERPPFSLAVIIDTSGSMAGGKLARAIEAILGIIDKLKPGDLLHLVRYSETASLIFENGTVQEASNLKKLTRELRPSGGTGMSFGIQMGRDVLEKVKLKHPKMISKMFVFTDGQTYSGITSLDGISQLVSQVYQLQIGVSAFGIGTDFDANMMKCIADAGHGHNFFIENFSEIVPILEKAFGGLTRTVATNVVLKVKGADGRPVRKFGAKNEDLLKGTSLGDVREKDYKQLLLEMEVETNLNSGEEVEVIEYEISYDRVDDCIPEGPLRGQVKLQVVDEIPRIQDYDSEVLVMLKIGECGKMDKEIAELLDQRRLDDAILKKRKVVEALTSVEDLDAIGFAKVLLMRAKKSLKELLDLKNAKSSRSYDSIKQAAKYEAEEEEDGEMGFGLFD